MLIEATVSVDIYNKRNVAYSTAYHMAQGKILKIQVVWQTLR